MAIYLAKGSITKAYNVLKSGNIPRSWVSFIINLAGIPTSASMYLIKKNTKESAVKFAQNICPKIANSKQLKTLIGGSASGVVTTAKKRYARTM